jgi:glycosyltransferase involved in cell wall biosynthesis/REP element-mobilizing transposase RayT
VVGRGIGGQVLTLNFGSASLMTMARPLRLEFEGGVYYVTARGWERQDVVRDDEDRANWVRLMDRVVVRFGWRVFAWALMRNHWHLFLSTPEANLSRGMHDLNARCSIAALSNLANSGNYPRSQESHSAPGPVAAEILRRARSKSTEEAGMDASTRKRDTAGKRGRSSAKPDAALAAPIASDRSGLRVALVHDWLTGMRGGEKCLEVLCRAFPQATLYTLLHRPGSTSPVIESMAIRTSPLQRVPGVFRHYRHLLPLMPLAARAWKPRNIDLVVSLSHCVAKAVRVPRGVPHVCYCFTPMRYAWQGRDSYLESWAHRPLRRALAGYLLDRLKVWDRATETRVTHFVAISQTIRERIATCYERDSRVIPPPVDTEFYYPAAGSGPREEFYLVVSALVSYKRIDQAVAACSRLGRMLVVIGAGPERQRLEKMAGATVRFLGWQPDEVIRDHYRRCRALLFPGEEDFGIVPVEALACGSPVLALGRGGAVETVDSTIGRLYGDPTVTALEETIAGWEAEGCPHDPVLARRRAESFSLPLFRNRILDLLAEVTDGSTSSAVPPRPHVDLSRVEKPDRLLS